MRSSAVTSVPPGPGAGISIARGDRTTIRQWPWQVALAGRQSKGRKIPPRERFFCGGSVIAPKLVITAAHCVIDERARKIEVISGRSWLDNTNHGEVTGVKRIVLPRKNGFLRYDGMTHSWDVALMVLKKPVSAPPIKLAGPDEATLWKPGQPVWATGWGQRAHHNRANTSRVLRVARQVMFPDPVCRSPRVPYELGKDYEVRTMNCLGGPAGNATTCQGDSGGPVVAATADGEYRLVGLTSFGFACRGWYPSYYARVSGRTIRSWVMSTARRLSGAEVVGVGGVPPAPPSWCRIPRVTGLTVPQARRKLKRNGCGLGQVERDLRRKGPRGRITWSGRIPGWIAPEGFRMRVWLPARR